MINDDDKIRKAILNIEKRIIEIDNILSDLSMKLCHIIKEQRSYFDMLEGREP